MQHSKNLKRDVNPSSSCPTNLLSTLASRRPPLCIHSKLQYFHQRKPIVSSVACSLDANPWTSSSRRLRSRNGFSATSTSRQKLTCTQAAVNASGPWDDSNQNFNQTARPSLGSVIVSGLLSKAKPVIQFVVLYRDILQRIVVTLAMLAVFRVGMFIPLPGLDFDLLPAPPATSEGELYYAVIVHRFVHHASSDTPRRTTLCQS